MEDISICLLHHVYLDDESGHLPPELYTISIHRDGENGDSVLNENNKFLFFGNKDDSLSITKYYLGQDFEQDYFDTSSDVFLLDSIVEIQTKNKQPKKAWLLQTMELLYDFYMTGIFKISEEDELILGEFTNILYTKTEFIDFFSNASYSRNDLISIIYKVYGMILCNSYFLNKNDIKEIKKTLIVK